jgi:hypothetical protein
VGEAKGSSGGFDAKVRTKASPMTSERCADCVLDADRERFVKLGRNSAKPGGFTIAADPAVYSPRAPLSQFILPTRAPLPMTYHPYPLERYSVTAQDRSRMR